MKGLVDDAQALLLVVTMNVKGHVEPTLVDFKTDYMRLNPEVMGQEIFGPVLPIFHSNLMGNKPY